MTFTTFAMHSFADVADNAGTASNADPSIPETGTEPAESEQGKGSSVNADDAISYYNYKQEHQNDKDATKQVVINGDNLINADDLQVGEYEGEDKTVLLNEEESATWSFYAPESAMYAMTFRYHTVESKGRDMEFTFMVDGEYPYESAGNISLKRAWVDDGEIKVGANGNETAPYQKEVYKWMTSTLKDNESYSSDTFLVYLTEGQHTYTVTSTREPLVIGSITFHGQETIPTQAEYVASVDASAGDYSGEPIIMQGELATEKSDSSLIPSYDRISPITQGVNSAVNSPSKILRNTMGKNSWSKPGQWLSYTVDVPEDGWYSIGVRYLQNTQVGMAVCRNIYIDGVIPSQDFEGIDFKYDASWASLVVPSENGDPSKVYLTKGQHEIKMEVTLGKWSDIMEQVNQADSDIIDIYSEIIMITGTSPDKYTDYSLDIQIPGIQEEMQRMSDLMYSLADQYDELYGEGASNSDTLRTIAFQMADFAEDPDSIPDRLTTFSDNILQISNWLMTNTGQPLEIDYITLQSPSDEAPRTNGNIGQRFMFSVRKFIASFFENYTSISSGVSSDEAITVWINQGRDQANALNDLIQSEFTPETGIQVELSMVQLGIVEATLAGKGPDVCINLYRSQPVDLAWRNALVDISQFEGFEEVKSRFTDGAFIPYTFEGGVYAVPYTQTFLMMYYRTDIFRELGISEPETWDDIYSLIPILQRKNMTIGIPYNSTTTQLIVNQGIGVKDIFATLLYQNGGSLYTDDNRHTALDSQAALDSFEMWVDFYKTYDFNRDYDLNTEFRTGQLPLAFASIEIYNTLLAAAPEIRGQWAMAPLPGVEQEDGTINHVSASSGSATSIFANADNYENCWKFVEWFSRDDIQEKYATNVENIAGAGARIMTANTSAFENIGWSTKELNALNTQRENLAEIPEVPGGYFVIRSVDNAFRSVVDQNKNTKETFEKQYKNIEDEMQRKWNEYETSKARR
mgnify:CR=1 FL=1